MNLIDHHPDAPEGSVTEIPSYAPSDFSPDDAILCRVTAPLVSLAFGFIQRHTGVRILGREIGANLVTLVKKMNTTEIDHLQQKLRTWKRREMDKCFARGHESAAAAIEDKVDCLEVFIDQLTEDSRTVTVLCQNIELLFSDNNRGLLTLCSVHKSKGLEWPSVFILDRDKYMPSKYATQAWQLKQEHNLIYVAVTRAKLNLHFITSGRWKDPKPKDYPLVGAETGRFSGETDEERRLRILDGL